MLNLSYDTSVAACILAHEWGAYARPCRSSDIHPVSIYNYQNNSKHFGENVYYVSGLCLVGNGGAPTLSHHTLLKLQ